MIIFLIFFLCQRSGFESGRQDNYVLTMFSHLHSIKGSLKNFSNQTDPRPVMTVMQFHWQSISSKSRMKHFLECNVVLEWTVIMIARGKLGMSRYV